jgi:hypothetical protein
MADVTGERLPGCPQGQSATARFSRTAVKCDSSIGDCTAIRRQFAQSSPTIQ